MTEGPAVAAATVDPPTMRRAMGRFATGRRGVPFAV